jgi:hypothetical protein
MIRGPHRAVYPFVLAVVLFARAAVWAEADIVQCQRTIVKAGTTFVQAKTKALAKCEEAIVKGKIAGPCPDTKTAGRIANATAALSRAIDKACGGADKICGGDRFGEHTPLDLGWPATCPNFAHGSCTNTITDCGGIATCIACAGEAAVDQAIGLYYDDLALPSAGAVRACQLAIGKAAVKFHAAKTKALQKCWDARLAGRHGEACVPPNVADGKYLDAIARADGARTKAICKQCGGPDKACGTMDDLTPAAIGFPATCPASTVPGGAACGGPVTDLTSLAACVGCLTEFDADCTDRLQVPALTPYPGECNACFAPPPTGPCPTTLEFTADGPGTELDTGFTGLAHDAHVPTHGRLTLAVSGCPGTNQPTCGECTVGGPLPNAGGVAFDNQRCSDAPWIACADDGDCANAGVSGPCVFFFGAPLPLVAGSVPSCVVNVIAGPVTGTANLDDGTSATQVPLSSRVYVQGSVSHPCPICRDGLCAEGARIHQPCQIQGSGEFGDVSLDCVPTEDTLTSALAIPLHLATGAQARTVTTANPTCTANGYTGRKCLCDTCNNVNAEACATNADCPMSGGSPGICGGKRCQGGTNEGAPCALNSACPSGLCGRPGEATKPNACLDDTSTAFDGTLCQPVGADEGLCVEGPFGRHCSVQTFRGCLSDADCTDCDGCLPGQTCRAASRDCFTDNGVLGGAVELHGTPDAPCDGISYPTVGSFFCVAPIAEDSINATAGLPALGRIRVPGTVVVAP